MHVSQVSQYHTDVTIYNTVFVYYFWMVCSTKFTETLKAIVLNTHKYASPLFIAHLIGYYHQYWLQKYWSQGLVELDSTFDFQIYVFLSLNFSFRFVSSWLSQNEMTVTTKFQEKIFYCRHFKPTSPIETLLKLKTAKWFSPVFWDHRHPPWKSETKLLIRCQENAPENWWAFRLSDIKYKHNL